LHIISWIILLWLTLISKSIRLNKKAAVIALTFIASLPPVYLLNQNITTFENHAYALMSLMSVLVSLSLVIITRSGTCLKPLLILYILAISVNPFFIALSSYYLGYPGYGKLINLMSGTLVNSPAVANSIGLLLVTLISATFERGYGKLSIAINLLIYTLIAVTIVLGIYLESRMFWMLLLLALIFKFLQSESLKRKSLFIIPLMFLLLGFTVLLGLGSGDYWGRIGVEGLESDRWGLWAHGLGLFIYPLGADLIGEFVGTEGRTHTWYHNFVLDSFRAGGYIFLAPFILSILLGSLFLRTSKLDSGVVLILLATFFIIMQDVILEGNRNMIVVFYLALMVSVLGGCSHSVYGGGRRKFIEA